VSCGILYGIGLGPGDPELLTRKAYRLLTEVPVIFYPSCGGKPQGFALQILQQVFGADAESCASGGMEPSPRPTVLDRCQPLPITMVRGLETARPHWAQAAEAVAAVLRSGRDAAFVAEGDPLVYSTFVYLRDALTECCPEATVEVVPGISSITAAAARALFPLGMADERVAVLPATFDPQFLDQALDGFDTVVLLKVSRVLDQVIALLEQRGLLEDAVFVERCGTPRERIVHDLASLRGRRADYFSLLLVRNRHRRAG
jgi:precorrin-2/cobalt-factor-2 C20-methyltransferase